MISSFWVGPNAAAREKIYTTASYTAASPRNDCFRPAGASGRSLTRGQNIKLIIALTIIDKRRNHFIFTEAILPYLMLRSPS